MKAELVPVDGAPGHVRIRFSVDGRGAQWLARPRAFLGRRPDGDYLEFDPPVDYLGREVKRRPYQEQELLHLDAGESIETDEVDLQAFYELPSDTVRVRYAAYHPLDGPESSGGPMEPVVSDWVKLGPT